MEQSLSAERAPAEGQAWRPHLVFALLLSYFGLFGVVSGSLGVLWSEVVPTLRISKATFGSAQFIAPLISIGLLLAGGYLTAWAGKKRLALVSLVAMGSAVLILAFSPNLLGLMAALAVKGVANALLETSANAATLDWEQATGRSVMNVMHAGFSAGAVIGASMAGLLLSQGWRYPQIMLLLVLLSALCAIVTLPVRYPPLETQSETVAGPGTTLKLLFSSKAILVLAVLMLLGIVGENVANLWSVIYLRELGAQAFVGGAAFALFNGAMFVGRLVNTPLLARWGARVSLLVSGIGLIGGTILLLLPGADVRQAIAAFALLGLGVAGVIPTALSVAARRLPGNSGAVASGLMAVAYVCFIICPPLVGWLADLFSLRAAWIVVGLSGVAIVWLGHTVREPQR